MYVLSASMCHVSQPCHKMRLRTLYVWVAESEKAAHSSQKLQLHISRLSFLLFVQVKMGHRRGATTKQCRDDFCEQGLQQVREHSPDVISAAINK